MTGEKVSVEKEIQGKWDGRRETKELDRQEWNGRDPVSGKTTPRQVQTGE